jgi:hypothetical protein
VCVLCPVAVHVYAPVLTFHLPIHPHPARPVTCHVHGLYVCTHTLVRTTFADGCVQVDKDNILLINGRLEKNSNNTQLLFSRTRDQYSYLSHHGCSFSGS